MRPSPRLVLLCLASLLAARAAASPAAGGFAELSCSGEGPFYPVRPIRRCNIDEFRQQGLEAAKRVLAAATQARIAAAGREAARGKTRDDFASVSLPQGAPLCEAHVWSVLGQDQKALGQWRENPKSQEDVDRDLEILRGISEDFLPVDCGALRLAYAGRELAGKLRVFGAIDQVEEVKSSEWSAAMKAGYFVRPKNERIDMEKKAKYDPAMGHLLQELVVDAPNTPSRLDYGPAMRTFFSAASAAQAAALDFDRKHGLSPSAPGPLPVPRDLSPERFTRECMDFSKALAQAFHDKSVASLDGELVSAVGNSAAPVFTYAILLRAVEKARQQGHKTIADLGKGMEHRANDVSARAVANQKAADLVTNFAAKPEAAVPDGVKIAGDTALPLRPATPAPSPIFPPQRAGATASNFANNSLSPTLSDAAKDSANPNDVRSAFKAFLSWPAGLVGCAKPPASQAPVDSASPLAASQAAADLKNP